MLHYAEQYAGPGLDELATFLAIAAAGSLTAAARRLGLPKSTVSRRLSRLEEKLGVQLVQRTTRHFSLTEAGLGYQERIARTFAGLEEANAAVREEQETPRGHVRLTAPVDLALARLAPVVAEFTARYPQTSVELILTERNVDLIGEGIDLALRAASSLPDSSLVAKRLMSIDLILVASPSYLEARGRPQTLADLAHHRLVARAAPQERPSLRLRGPEGETTLAIEAAIVASDFSFVTKVIAEGGGIGAVPSLVAASELRAGVLERVLPTYDGGAATLFVLHGGGRLLPAKVRALRDLLVERLGSS